MKKLFIIAFVIVLQFFGIAEPAFAGLPYGSKDVSWHPNYLRQIQYIQDNSCNAVAMIPYNGEVFYTCSNGQRFWAEVLLPTESSPLFMYFKNRKKQNDEDSADDSSDAAVNASFMFN
jgi:hypothetical protein